MKNKIPKGFTKNKPNKIGYYNFINPYTFPEMQMVKIFKHPKLGNELYQYPIESTLDNPITFEFAPLKNINGFWSKRLIP